MVKIKPEIKFVRIVIEKALKFKDKISKNNLRYKTETL